MAIDYMGMLPQVDLGGRFLRGLQSAGALAELSKIGQQQEQAKRAQEQQALYEAEVADALKSPSAERFAALTAKFPQQREAFKQSWDTLSEGQRRDDFGAASRAFAALNSGRPDLAESIFTQRLEAKKASGADASEDQMVLDIIKTDPKQAQGFLGYTMFNADPDKYAENIGKLGAEQRAAEQAPAELETKRATAQEAAAKAKTAEVTAKYADSQAIADLTKKKWDITKIVEDINIGREQNRIRAMEVAASKEGNALKREELQLKIDEAKRTRDEKILEKAAEAETAITGIDNTVTLINDILSDEDTLRAAVGTSAWRGALPGTKARAMAGKIEQLVSAVASTNLDKLKGAMSDNDLKFIKNIEANLDRYQDEEKFISEVKRVAGSLEQAREKTVKKFGAEGTEAAEGKTLYEAHPIYGTVTERRVRTLARESKMTPDEVRAFLEERAKPEVTIPGR